MNIVLFTEDFYPTVSGGAHIQWRVCEVLAERGNEVTVFTYRVDDMDSDEIVDGVRIRRPVGRLPGPSVISRALTALAILLLAYRPVGRHDPDGLYAADSPYLFWTAKILSVRYSLPLVNYIAFSTSLDDSASPFKRVLENVTFRFALGDHVFLATADVAERIDALTDRRTSQVRACLRGETVRAAGAATDLEAIRTDLGIGPDVRLLAFVSRLVPIKRPTVAVDVLAALPENYHLLMIGDGPEAAAVRERARSEGVAERLTMLGILSHEETLQRVAASDGLLLTSRVDANPTVVYEALSYGRPVFSTPVGTIRSLDNPRVHLAEAESLPDAIAAVAIEPQTPVELDEDVLETFSLSTLAVEIETGLEALLENMPAGAH